QRMHAITDFIAVAQTLIATKATTPALLVAAGESAGGALVAGAVNLRPELFAAAVLRVPFLDAIGTMADPTAPLTTLEYQEWGDPAVRADYDLIKSWCPYTNIAQKHYPPILVESSLADERVAYHEQARYVARLRARGRGGPFVLRTEISAGHGGASSRPKWLRARADELAFILTRLRSLPGAR
ncbi:MAG TPA: prolyl oligopeptidase family serine peptidase, partial [Nannocystis sp.]